MFNSTLKKLLTSRNHFGTRRLLSPPLWICTTKDDKNIDIIIMTMLKE